MEKFWPKGINIDRESPMFKQMYEMMRKRKCDCGYNAESKKTKASDEKCPVTLAFNNHIRFSSLEILPKYDEPKELFYDEEGTPRFHWCLLVELHEKITPRCWAAFTTYGEKCILRFDNDERPTTFAWSDLKTGYTVAILYAEKYDDIQVVVDDLEYCFVFKSDIVDLSDEGKLLLDDADCNAKQEKSSCFGCGITCENIMRCANCKLAKYCSRECQAKCWKESHKKLCSQSETILRLASLPRHEFEEYLTFVPDQPESLPAYVFKPEFVHVPVSSNKKKVVEIKPEADTKCGLCNETNQKVFLKKGKPLTKTRCCNNWVCDDHHTYVMNSFLRNSCHRNHDRYTICGYHFTEGHEGRWQDCRLCKRGMSKVDYIDRSTNEYNFAQDKLDIKNRVMIQCNNCPFEDDNLNSFAGKVQYKDGDIKYYCKKEECKKKGDFEGPDNSFLCKFMLK